MDQDSRKNMEFRCPETGEMTKLYFCESCPDNTKCDIYATMLDELHDD